MKIFNKNECVQKLNQLDLIDTWKIEQNALTASFKLSNFKAALQFMVESGKICEQCDHHPNWQNTYNTVTVNLNTHSVGGITEKDFELAESMSKIFHSKSYLKNDFDGFGD